MWYLWESKKRFLFFERRSRDRARYAFGHAIFRKRLSIPSDVLGDYVMAFLPYVGNPRGQAKNSKKIKSVHRG